MGMLIFLCICFIASTVASIIIAREMNFFIEDFSVYSIDIIKTLGLGLLYLVLLYITMRFGTI